MEKINRKDLLFQRVMDRVDLSIDLSDADVLALIQEEICILSKDYYLSLEEREELQKQIFFRMRKLDVLEELLADDTITEIMVNGPFDIFVERAGELQKTDCRFTSAEKLNDVIQKIVSANNKIANESHPIVDTKLADGTRIHIVLPPIAIDGSAISIRKFPKRAVSMDTLVAWNSLSKDVAEFIKILVLAGYNIFVSGGTGSGKTTFLNAMAEYIPKEERVITIEDSAELQLLGVKNIVRLEAREATLEGKLAVSIRDLVKASLRMRPDRIIVGECRGQEAAEMLQAFNTGHDGSFSTGHANSAKDMLARLETMVLMAREIPLESIRPQIASGVDIIIHLGRLRDRSRKVVEVVEVLGMNAGNIKVQTLYEIKEIGGEDEVVVTWEKKNKLFHTKKLEQKGIHLS